MFKYQTFDREALTFSDHPIIPPPPEQMRYCDDDANESPKNDEPPIDPPVDIATSDPPAEAIDPPADTSAEGMFDLIDL